jgi:hypothetical protein
LPEFQFVKALELEASCLGGAFQVPMSFGNIFIHAIMWAPWAVLGMPPPPLLGIGERLPWEFGIFPRVDQRLHGGRKRPDQAIRLSQQEKSWTSLEVAVEAK